MTLNCGGSTYHQDSGVCEIGKVILIFLKHRRRLHLRQMHPFDKIQHEYTYEIIELFQ